MLLSSPQVLRALKAFKKKAKNSKTKMDIHLQHFPIKIRLQQTQSLIHLTQTLHILVNWAEGIPPLCPSSRSCINAAESWVYQSSPCWLAGMPLLRSVGGPAHSWRKSSRFFLQSSQAGTEILAGWQRSPISHPHGSRELCRTSCLLMGDESNQNWKNSTPSS